MLDQYSSSEHLKPIEDGLEVKPSSDPQYNPYNQEEPQVYYAAVQVQSNSQPAEPSHSEKVPSRKCGLSTPTFWLLVALATLIAVGIASGGALGGILSRKSNISSPGSTTSSASGGGALSIASTMMPTPASATATITTTSTPSSTFSTIISPTLTLSRDCPGSNGTILSTNYDPPQRYVKYCSWTFNSLFATQSNPFQAVTTTLDQCIELCAAYNHINGTGPWGNCSGVAWRTDLTKEFGGHCFGDYGDAAGQGQIAVGGSNLPADSALFLG